MGSWHEMVALQSASRRAEFLHSTCHSRANEKQFRLKLLMEMCVQICPTVTHTSGNVYGIVERKTSVLPVNTLPMTTPRHNFWCHVLHCPDEAISPCFVINILFREPEILEFQIPST
jgi:hypothetical protein